MRAVRILLECCLVLCWIRLKCRIARHYLIRLIALVAQISATKRALKEEGWIKRYNCILVLLTIQIPDRSYIKVLDVTVSVQGLKSILFAFGFIWKTSQFKAVIQWIRHWFSSLLFETNPSKVLSKFNVPFHFKRFRISVSHSECPGKMEINLWIVFKKHPQIVL